MKILLSIFVVLIIAGTAFAQSSPMKIVVPPPQKNNPPHFYRNGSGVLYVSLDGGRRWNKVGSNPSEDKILEDKEFSKTSDILTITPNPMKANGSITLKLQEAGEVEIVLMTIAGTRMQTLVSGKYEAGVRSWDLDTSQISSGVYICSMTIAGKTSRTLFTIQK
jgi:hypothetical protein